MLTFLGASKAQFLPLFFPAHFFDFAPSGRARTAVGGILSCTRCYATQDENTGTVGVFI